MDNPYNNDFVVANQFTIIENENNKRPDVILFVNGIPLVVIELKNAANENSEAKAMNLTDFKYAFYTAVANNDSAVFHFTGINANLFYFSCLPGYKKRKDNKEDGFSFLK